MLFFLRRYPRVALLSCCLIASVRPAFSQAADSRPAARSLTNWLQGVTPLQFPEQVNALWFSLPDPVPGITAELARVLREHTSAGLRLHAARALGEMALAPDLAVPALCSALMDTDATVRTQAAAALRRFGADAQRALWVAVGDFRPVGNARQATTALVSEYAAQALAQTPGIDPAPILEEYRSALGRGHWRSDETGSPGGPAGTVAHLRCLIGVILAQPDPTTVAGLAKFLADDDPRLRTVAEELLANADEAGVALPAVRQRLAVVSPAESHRLIQILGRSGAAALPDLLALRAGKLDPARKSATEQALRRLVTDQDLAFLLKQWAAGTDEEFHDILRDEILRADSQRPEPNAEQLRAIAANFRAHSASWWASDLEFARTHKLPPSIARAATSALVEIYPSLPEDRKSEAMEFIAACLQEFPGDGRMLAFVRERLKERTEDKVDMATFEVFAGLGATGDELVELIGRLERPYFQALQCLAGVKKLAPKSLDVLRSIVAEKEKYAEVRRAAFGQLVRLSPDPAQEVRRFAGVEPLQTFVHLAFVIHGEAGERAAALKALSAETILDLAIEGETDLLAAAVRVGRPELDEFFVQAWIDLDGRKRGVFSSIAEANYARAARSFSWEEKILAALPKMTPEGVDDVAGFLRSTPAGRTGLIRTVAKILQAQAAANRPADAEEPSPRFLIACLDSVAALGAAAAELSRQVQPLTRHEDATVRCAAISTLVSIAPQDSQTRASVIGALVDPDSAVVDRAFQELRTYAEQDIGLRPLWIAASLRQQMMDDDQIGKVVTDRVAVFRAHIERAVSEQLRTSPGNVGRIVENAVKSHAGYAADIVRAATVMTPTSAVAIVTSASKADPAQVASIIQSASAATSNQLNAIANAAITAAPGQRATIEATVAALSVQPTAGGAASEAPSRSGIVLPPFPWPIPTPSVPVAAFGKSGDLNRGLLGKDDETLGEVQARLMDAIGREGFTGSLFGVPKVDPDGFALMTCFERIEPNGEPAASNRFRRGVVSASPLESLVSRLFVEKPGFFRRIVFVFRPTGRGIELDPKRGKDDVPDVKNGGSQLPPELAVRKFGDFDVSVLVYVYEISRGPTIRDSSDIHPARFHLGKARIFKALQ